LDYATAHTFERIKVALQRLRSQKDTTVQGFANEIRKHKISAFKVRGEGRSIDDYMKAQSVVRLLLFMAELQLISIKGGEVELTDQGRNARSTESRFKNQIQSSVKSYLERKGVSYAEIARIGGEIELPETPNADSIFQRLQRDEVELSLDELRRALFLLACAEGASRRVKVHYEF